MIFANVSGVGSEPLEQRLRSFKGNFAEGVIFTQVVPPIDAGATIVLQFKEKLEKYYPSEPATFTSLEGYIAAALFVEGLKRTGANLTTEAMIHQLETIRDFDLGTRRQAHLRHQPTPGVQPRVGHRDRRRRPISSAGTGMTAIIYRAPRFGVPHRRA